MDRVRLPNERYALTRDFKLPYTHKDGSIDTMKFFFTAGLYEDGRLGEVFAKADKQGTLVGGLMDNVCINMSIGLQFGIPLDVFLQKMKGTRFPPSGFTKDAQFHSCSSPLDLLAQWLEKLFMFTCAECGERRAVGFKAEKTCITMSCPTRVKAMQKTLTPEYKPENESLSHSFQAHNGFTDGLCVRCSLLKDNPIHLTKDGSFIR